MSIMSSFKGSAIISVFILVAFPVVEPALAAQNEGQQTTAASMPASESAINVHEPLVSQVAATPPMGWNSYDCFGTSITEDEAIASAKAMQEKLLAHGWRYFVIDARWYDDVSSYDDRNFNKDRAGAKLASDQYGRLMPSVARFPSAAGGVGFKPLIDQIHKMGMKFGFHMMRGIPRQSVANNTPIAGSSFTAADAANTQSTCGWCPDMYGVKDNPAGQAWYDSMIALYASWGLDLIKVDDLSSPYSDKEIEMIHRAILKSGRPIVFSTSAGETPLWRADHIMANANMWRISGDFWDDWSKLRHNFDLLSSWSGCAGHGHWPDADMIPFGHIAEKCTIDGTDRQSRFTYDEQKTLMSLWCIARSPLILGADMRDINARTLGLLTNDEVLEVNKSSFDNHQVLHENGLIVWSAGVTGSRDRYVAVFNVNGGSRENPDYAPIDVSIPLTGFGFLGPVNVRDLWLQKEIGTSTTGLKISLAPHCAELYRLSPR